MGTDVTTNRARLLVAHAFALDMSLEWQVGRDLCLQAVNTARSAGDDATFVNVIQAVSRNYLAAPDARDQLVTDIETAVEMADRIGDPVLRAGIRRAVLWSHFERADIVGADAVVAEIEALTEIVGLPYQRWELATIVLGRLLLAGKADEAEKANERALELSTELNTTEGLSQFGGFLYAIRLHQGRLDEIAEIFVDAARDNPSVAALRSAVVYLLCVLGRVDEARGQLAAEAAAGFDFPYDVTWLASMANLLDAAATIQDHDAASELVARVAPFADHVIALSGVMVNGAISRPLAHAGTLLGDYDQAEQWFAIAHDIHNRLQAPFWTTRCQLDHADLYIARHADGDVQRARVLATSAAATADEFGCTGLTKRAEALLAEL